MSEWPLMYLVTECTTTSAPSDSSPLHHRCRCRWRMCCRLRTTTCVLLRDSSNGFQIRQFQQRVAGSFDPDHPCIGTNGGYERRGICRIDVRKIEPRCPPAHPFEEADTYRRKDYAASDDVRAMIEKFEDRRNCRQSRGEGERSFAIFQVGKAAFEGEPRRIVRTAVIKPFMDARRLLDVSAGGVDRRHDGPSRGVGRLPGMNGPRRQRWSWRFGLLVSSGFVIVQITSNRSNHRRRLGLGRGAGLGQKPSSLTGKGNCDGCLYD